MANTQGLMNGLCALSGVGSHKGSQIDVAQNDCVLEPYRVICLSVKTREASSVQALIALGQIGLKTLTLGPLDRPSAGNTPSIQSGKKHRLR